MVSRYTHQGYGEMFEHYEGDPVQPGDKIYYAEDDYKALEAALREIASVGCNMGNPACALWPKPP